MPKTKNACGLRIRQFRKEQEITQKKLATMTQLSRYDFITETATIKLKSGTRFIPDYEVNVFAQLLGITSEYLLQYNHNK